MDDRCRLTDPIDYPNYTQHPNVYYDWAMPLLTGAEWKVLCFLVRRTFGYHQERALVPITQDEIRVGTGCSRSTVAAALRDFEDHGFLEVARAVGDHGTEANSYRLRVSGERTAGVRKSDSLGCPPTGQPSPVKYKERNTPDPRKENGRFAALICAECGSRPCTPDCARQTLRAGG